MAGETIITITDLRGTVGEAAEFDLRPSTAVVWEIVQGSSYGGDRIFLTLGTEGLALVRSDDGYRGRVQIPMVELLKLAGQADPRLVLDTTPPQPRGKIKPNLN